MKGNYTSTTLFYTGLAPTVYQTLCCDVFLYCFKQFSPQTQWRVDILIACISTAVEMEVFSTEWLGK